MAITFEAQRIILNRCMDDLELCVTGFEQQAEAMPIFFEKEQITRARATLNRLETFSKRLSRIIT